MTFNYELANKFIDALFPLPDRFGTIRYSDDTIPANFDAIKDVLQQVDEEVEVRYGITKLVISSPNLGEVVLKIPFNGYYEYLPDFDEDYEEDFYNDYTDDGLLWTPYSCAPGSDCSDYCLTEYEKYLDLKRRHLDCFVAKIKLFKVVCGVRVFVQEWTTPKFCDETDRKPSRDSSKIVESWKNEKGYLEMDAEWIANCIDVYGEEKVKRFLNYCEHIDPDITEDAHGNNYGYRNNGTPCILDYSNFCDDMC